jgi:hypothetical protein
MHDSGEPPELSESSQLCFKRAGFFSMMKVYTALVFIMLVMSARKAAGLMGLRNIP